MRAVMDPKTGDLALDTGEVIGAALTRPSFLASPIAAGAAPFVQAPGAPLSYVDLGRRQLGGQTFVIGLGFEGDALRTVTLTMVQADESSSWDDWSEDAALACKARHDAWLEGQLGSLPWWFAWGDVASVYDPRGGSSSVRIRYGGHSRIACSLSMDRMTGDIALSTGERIGSGLTRSAFLSSPLASGPGPASHGAALAAFPVELRLPGGDAAALSLHFDGEALRLVVMSMIDHDEPPAADYRRAWADDQALARLLRGNEAARKARHDAWLLAQIGPEPWSYAWGTISSKLDSTFCASQIIVAYR